MKSSKVYLADSGLLHAVLGIRNNRDLMRHPKSGSSWEGFLLEQVIGRLGATTDECYFWATQAGAELDLLVVRGGKKLGFEFKLTETPSVSPSMRIASRDLGLGQLYVVHGGSRSWPMAEGIRAIAASHLLRELDPLPH